MFSAAVDNRRPVPSTLSIELRHRAKSEDHFQQWVEHPSSSIMHHDSPCCDEARLWFLAYAHSMEMRTLSQYDIKAPVWLSELFTWGPSRWPISWCQLVKEKTLDCGVFAALAREVFKAQGHEAHPAQALLSYNELCTGHWKTMWASMKGENSTFPWIGEQMVYHEICVLELPSGVARVYDSTWGNWYENYPRSGFGALLALRTECPRLLRWGDKTISCGEWTEI